MTRNGSKIRLLLWAWNWPGCSFSALGFTWRSAGHHVKGPGHQQLTNHIDYCTNSWLYKGGLTWHQTHTWWIRELWMCETAAVLIKFECLKACWCEGPAWSPSQLYQFFLCELELQRKNRNVNSTLIWVDCDSQNGGVLCGARWHHTQTTFCDHAPTF